MNESTGFAVCLGVHTTVQYRMNCWMRQFPNPERLGKGKGTSERASQSSGNGFRNKADCSFQGFSSGTSFSGPAYQAGAALLVKKRQTQ